MWIVCMVSTEPEGRTPPPPSDIMMAGDGSDDNTVITLLTQFGCVGHRCSILEEIHSHPDEDQPW
ncbi:hypothetical protein EI94DRAFT_1751516 [Lactarius quietus]|nr:hypothetical protein EI94DRAFT_1751516 [Lactarius quietus]